MNLSKIPGRQRMFDLLVDCWATHRPVLVKPSFNLHLTHVGEKDPFQSLDIRI
jgi:hypothetical protein